VAGVEALLVQIGVDLLGVGLADEAQEIDQAASQPIHRPAATMTTSRCVTARGSAFLASRRSRARLQLAP
jgi:hypothetical protein